MAAYFPQTVCMQRIIVLLGFFFFNYFNGQTQDLSQVITNHSRVIGIESRRNTVTLCLEGELVLNLYGKDHIFPFKKILHKPDKLLTIMEFEGRKRISGFDGENFWVQDLQSMNQGKSIDIIQSRVEANLEGLVKFYRDSLIVSVEKVKYRNIDYLKLSIRTKDDYNLHYYVNPETYLVDILQIPIEDSASHKMLITEYRYSDYREVSGLKYPFGKEYYFNQELKSFERIQTIDINCKGDEKSFSKP